MTTLKRGDVGVIVDCFKNLRPASKSFDCDMASLLDVEESEDLLERERLPADIAIRRKPRGSRLRQCAVSGAPVVWAVTLLLLIQAVLVGLKLDVLAMASVSW